MEGKIDKANKLGGAISIWGKLLIGLVVLIVGGGTTYYQIESNAAANVRQDEQFKQILETMKHEFEIWGDRSDKRYARTVSKDIEISEDNDKQDDQILELTKEVWYLKGKLDEQDRH